MGLEMVSPTLRLSVKAKNWRMNDAGSTDADAEFQIVRRNALDRDDYTCALCKFKAAKWQEVHHVNDDHSDNTLSNLMTVCSFCHMCQHIGLAGRNEEAVLVWLPEIPQATLHHLVRTILVGQRWAETATQARAARAEVVKQAQATAAGANRLMGELRAREDQAEQMMGTSDLLEIANIMLATPDDVYERRHEFLHGFRMLPLGVRFNDGSRGKEDVMAKMVDSWMEPGGAYVNLRPQSWLTLFKNSLTKN